ncbi:MAG: hypothetical protein ACRDMV_04405 [Streptosporangiales bacterium]
MSYLDDLPAHGEEPWDSQLITALGDINSVAEAAQTTADGKVSPGDLAPVATSGAYSDLSGTPAVPDDGDYVALTGDQTVGGVKRFNDSPLVPAPALGESDRAVNVGYVDALNYADVGALPDTYTPPDQSWNQITGKPSTFPPSAHDHDASDITSGHLSSARGGTGINITTFGSYLRTTGTSAPLEQVDPSVVRSDIGAAEEVAASIGWTSFSTQSPATTTDRARARRHATGLVEVQLSIDVGSLSSGDVVTNDLPSWVIPADGHPLSVAPAVNSSTTGTTQVNITPAGEIKVFADNPGSVKFVRFVAVYTP